MGASGPLDQPKLREIDEQLDARELDQAAALLAALSDVALFRHATSYLATRLLFLRGRLDVDGVIQRLVELLGEVKTFPEAQAMLDAAYSGELLEFGTARKLRAEKEARRSRAPDARESDYAHSALSAAAVVHRESSAPPLGADEPDIDSSPAADDLSVDASAEDSEPARLPTAPLLPQIEGAARTAQGVLDGLGGRASPAERDTAQGSTAQAVDESATSPAWVIPSLQPRGRSRHASLPVPELPPSKRPPDVVPTPEHSALASALERQLSPSLNAASLHVSSRPPPRPDEAPPPRAHSSVPGQHPLAPPPRSPAQPAQAQPAQESAAGVYSSSLSDGSVRPRAGDLSASALQIPRAPGLPTLDAATDLRPTSQLSYDVTQRKSQLPPQAGLYSAWSEEEPLQRDQEPAAAIGAPQTTAAVQSGHVQAQPARIRSVPPPAVGPSLFELASWLDAGEARRVVDAVQATDPSPDFRLMRCRALLAAGDLPRAREELDTLGATPLLEPELRATLARLLIELGEPEAALAQASRACADDPSAEPARLALGWSLIRVERRRNDPALIKRAHEALSEVSATSSRYAGLIFALRACVQASVGDSDKAIAVAQRAIGMDPDSVDALAALAVATARLGRLRDAQQAWCRVLDLDHQEADALSETLEALGVDLQQALPGPAPVATAEPVWHELELKLPQGNVTGLCELEQHAQRHIERVTAMQRTELQVLAALSAGYLNTAPCFRNFAPFDISLHSVQRLEAALLASYGRGPRPDLSSDHWALAVTLGSYLGEVLRQAHAGRWSGSLEDAVHARVLARAGTWEPLRLIQARLLGGSSHDLSLALRSAFPPSNSKEWEHRVPIAVLPATPWQGEWPSASAASALGAALKGSVISSYLERRGLGALDGSYADFARLDSYLELVAPARAPSVEDESTRRACGLLGCHVGEVVRAEFGGQWIDQALSLDAAAASGPQQTALVIGTGRKLMPLKVVADRLGTDRKFSLQEWHQTLSLRR